MGIWDENQNFEIIGIRFVIVFVLILSPLCHNLSQNFRLYNTRWRLSRDLSYKQINVCEIFQVKWNLETFCSSTFCWCTWAKKKFSLVSSGWLLKVSSGLVMTLDTLLRVAGELQFSEEPLKRHQGHAGDHREWWAYPAGAAEQGMFQMLKDTKKMMEM